jgi:hypothetical protein
MRGHTDTFDLLILSWKKYLCKEQLPNFETVQNGVDTKSTFYTHRATEVQAYFGPVAPRVALRSIHNPTSYKHMNSFVRWTVLLMKEAWIPYRTVFIILKFFVGAVSNRLRTYRVNIR